MALRRTRLALLSLLCPLAACGSSSLSMVIYTNPPDATVYLDGVRVQKGTSLAHDFDFSDRDRILVQAASPGYETHVQYVTRRSLEGLIRSNEKLRCNLRVR